MKYIQVRHKVATMAQIGSKLMADSLCDIDIDLNNVEDVCALAAVELSICVGIFFIGRIIITIRGGCLPCQPPFQFVNFANLTLF